jgi:hypothetical protein
VGQPVKEAKEFFAMISTAADGMRRPCAAKMYSMARATTVKEKGIGFGEPLELFTAHDPLHSGPCPQYLAASV